MSKRIITFNEIIECSNQKSILTGKAGFGIRTITKGLDADFARKVTSQINNAYEVDINRQVSKRALMETPAIVTEYPRTFKYMVVTDNTGNEKYALACSTYVGIDYGYFCNMENYQRPGSNYISNILIFDEQPTANLFYELLRQNVFLPVDNTCLPDNKELQELLTGEPQYLEPRSVEVPEVSDCVERVTQTGAKVAMALLQTKINKDLGRASGLQNIVFQAEEAVRPFGTDGPAHSHMLDVVKAFAAMPDGLLADKYFQTNYQQGHGMPNGYRMLFLNQYNKEQVYIEDYVYLNIDNGELKNVDTDNYFFGKLREAVRDNDSQLFRKLVKYLYSLNIQEDSDFVFLYNLYMATETVEKLKISVLTGDFFDKVRKANLPSDKLDVLKKNISKTLSAAIPAGDDHGVWFEDAMNVITLLLRDYREFLDTFEKDKNVETDGHGNDVQRATNYMFLYPQNFHYLQELDLNTIKYVCNYDIDEEDFYKALSSVSSHDVWTALVNDFYAGRGVSYADESDTVISQILKSPKLGQKAELVKRLFPVDNNINLFAGYIKNHPETIAPLESVVCDICRQKGKEGIMYFLKVTNYSDDAVRVLQPIAEEYFRSQMRGDYNIGELCGFLRQIRQGISHGEIPNSFHGFDFSNLYAQYEEYCRKFPKNANEEWMDTIIECGGLRSDCIKDTFITIKALTNMPTGGVVQGGYNAQHLNNRGEVIGVSSRQVEQDVPKEVRGTTKDLMICRNLDNKNKRLKVFIKWVDAYGDETAMKEYLKEKIEVKEFEDMLDIVWNRLRRIDSEKRRRLTMAMLDAYKWPKKEREGYLLRGKNVVPDEAKACVKQYYGFSLGKIFKLFGRIFNSKKGKK